MKKTKRAGRKPIIRDCPWCGKPKTAREMYSHIGKCQKRPK